MTNPRLIVEYNSDQQACTWTIDPGFPIKDMIHAFDLIKHMAMSNQITQMEQHAQASRIVVPDLKINNGNH